MDAFNCISSDLTNKSFFHTIFKEVKVMKNMIHGFRIGFLQLGCFDFKLLVSPSFELEHLARMLLWLGGATGEPTRRPVGRLCVLVVALCRAT